MRISVAALGAVLVGATVATCGGEAAEGLVAAVLSTCGGGEFGVGEAGGASNAAARDAVAGAAVAGATGLSSKLFAADPRLPRTGLAFCDGKEGVSSAASPLDFAIEVLLVVALSGEGVVA